MANRKHDRQIDLVVSLLFSREDLAESIQLLCNELGFETTALLPKNPEDFGTDETPSIFKSLRYRNYEKKRAQRVIKLLQEMRNRRIIAWDRDDLTFKKKESKSVTPSKAPSRQDPQLRMEHRRNVHETAAVNFILSIKGKIKKIKNKQDGHRKALNRLKEFELERSKHFGEIEERRRKILQDNKIRLNQFEKMEIKKMLERSASTTIASKPHQRFKSSKSFTSKEKKEELEDLLPPMQTPTTKTDRSSSVVTDLIRVLKIRQEKDMSQEKKARQLEIDIAEKLMQTKIKRDERIINSVKKLKQSNLEKIQKIQDIKKAQRTALREGEIFAKEKEKILEDRIKRQEEQKHFENSIHVEKKNIRKQNQIEKLKEHERILMKKKQAVLNKAGVKSTPLIHHTDISPLFHDSLLTTKMNTNKIIANLRRQL